MNDCIDPVPSKKIEDGELERRLSEAMKEPGVKDIMEVMDRFKSTSEVVFQIRQAQKPALYSSTTSSSFQEV